MTVTAGGTVTENVTPPLADITVSGQVSDNQGDLPSAGTITALNTDGAAVATATIDSSGGFTLSGLSAGTYTLSGVANGFLITPQPVTVADDDDISNLNLSANGSSTRAAARASYPPLSPATTATSPAWFRVYGRRWASRLRLRI